MKISSKNNQLKFTIPIFIVFIGAIVFAGWFLFDQHTDETTTINSFEECAAAGYPIMESYPPRCSANGKTFVD